MNKKSSDFQIFKSQKMSVLIFVEQAQGAAKKASLEAITYGVDVAKTLGIEANALVLGEGNFATLGNYGISKVYQVTHSNLANFDAQVYAHVIKEAIAKTAATVAVFSHNQTGKALSARVAAAAKAGLVAGAIGLPQITDGFVVKKSVFSGKAFANVSINSAVKIISLNPNSYKTVNTNAGDVTVEVLTMDVPTPKVTVTAVNKSSGDIPLTEADIVVSGGRGLKGPENWGIILDLAKELGAATACSRPVGDAHWRPHHEHVGQTGVQVAPNLYIAVGISGAIQHLAGVNRSKVIVVINKDPEAPFFKAADYGIVGDCFEVLPKLTEEIKKLKSKSV